MWVVVALSLANRSTSASRQALTGDSAEGQGSDAFPWIWAFGFLGVLVGVFGFGIYFFFLRKDPESEDMSLVTARRVENPLRTSTYIPH